MIGYVFAVLINCEKFIIKFSQYASMYSKNFRLGIFMTYLDAN